MSRRRRASIRRLPPRKPDTRGYCSAAFGPAEFQFIYGIIRRTVKTAVACTCLEAAQGLRRHTGAAETTRPTMLQHAVDDQELKPLFLSSTDASQNLTSDSSSSSVWSVLPSADVAKDMSSTLAASTAAGTSDRPASGIVSITDAAAAAYGQNAYYNTTYPTSYSMYASSPATYYQQVASGLRAQNAAAAFPYSFAANPTAYYGGSYGVDYTAYNNQYYQGIRSGYYPNPLATPAAAYAVQSAASLSTASATSADSPAVELPFSLKAEKKCKAKKKKTGSCSPGDVQYARVFIWDVEDICMLSRNFFNQVTQNSKFLPYVAPAMLLNQLVERVVSLSFSEHAEECDLMNIEDAAMEESLTDGSIVDARGVDMMRRVASKYLALRELYQECAAKQKADTYFSYELLDRCGLSAQEEELTQAAQQMQSLFSHRWQAANRCLDLVTQRSTETQEKYANVVTCGEGLVSGIVQSLVAGHSAAVPIDNVYSTSKIGKEAIFEKIQARYGKKCSFICVTSNHDTSNIAKKLSIPVWPIASSNDLEKLFTAQRLYLLATTAVSSEVFFLSIGSPWTSGEQSLDQDKAKMVERSPQVGVTKYLVAKTPLPKITTVLKDLENNKYHIFSNDERLLVQSSVYTERLFDFEEAFIVFEPGLNEHNHLIVKKVVFISEDQKKAFEKKEELSAQVPTVTAEPPLRVEAPKLQVEAPPKQVVVQRKTTEAVVTQKLPSELWNEEISRISKGSSEPKPSLSAQAAPIVDSQLDTTNIAPLFTINSEASSPQVEQTPPEPLKVNSERNQLPNRQNQNESEPTRTNKLENVTIRTIGPMRKSADHSVNTTDERRFSNRAPMNITFSSALPQNLEYTDPRAGFEQLQPSFSPARSSTPIPTKNLSASATYQPPSKPTASTDSVLPEKSSTSESSTSKFALPPATNPVSFVGFSNRQQNIVAKPMFGASESDADSLFNDTLNTTLGEEIRKMQQIYQQPTPVPCDVIQSAISCDLERNEAEMDPSFEDKRQYLYEKYEFLARSVVYPFAVEGFVTRSKEQGKIDLFTHRLGRLTLNDFQIRKSYTYGYLLVEGPGVYTGADFYIFPPGLKSTKFVKGDTVECRGFGVMSYGKRSSSESQWFLWSDHVGLMRCQAGCARDHLKKYSEWEPTSQLMSFVAVIHGDGMWEVKTISQVCHREDEQANLWPVHALFLDDLFLERNLCGSSTVCYRSETLGDFVNIDIGLLCERSRNLVSALGGIVVPVYTSFGTRRYWRALDVRRLEEWQRQPYLAAYRKLRPNTDLYLKHVNGPF
ncbi:unnamed protein product [Caenorhabditis auriculariae]|uniref:Eyes absent homolog n=1 Tax=Caenorhabditis auriculariae TaxID=2777116 RepID=A0A8S1H520_9PELO|nr:unnamed protein product [Caenorhabditis auriculariae]